MIFSSLSEFFTVYCDPHKGFGIVNQAEIDVFLELSHFFDDPADVGNLISGSSAFSKTILNIREFTVHVLLKPGLENFEHYIRVKVYFNLSTNRKTNLDLKAYCISLLCAKTCAERNVDEHDHLCMYFTD